MRPRVAIINELPAPARAQQDDPDVYHAGSIVTAVLRPDPSWTPIYAIAVLPGSLERPISCASAEASGPLREVLL
jgi:hypothetical protein